MGKHKMSVVQILGLKRYTGMTKYFKTLELLAIYSREKNETSSCIDSALF